LEQEQREAVSDAVLDLTGALVAVFRALRAVQRALPSGPAREELARDILELDARIDAALKNLMSVKRP
jgi:VIT1/CCC1 family predicted Fe2+/Mn2+ transporter